jgi:heme/copper-type cytochrome/quinol oxidase subunit 2
MAFGDLNESTLPMMSLTALVFVVIMGTVYGATMLMHITNETGEEDIPFNLFGMFNAWVITIALIILAMIILIGLSIVRKHA